LLFGVSFGLGQPKNAPKLLSLVCSDCSAKYKNEDALSDAVRSKLEKDLGISFEPGKSTTSPIVAALLWFLR